MCHDYDCVLKMNGGAVYFIPTVLELSHAHVPVRVSNEINRLVIVQYLLGLHKW